MADGELPPERLLWATSNRHSTHARSACRSQLCRRAAPGAAPRPIAWKRSPALSLLYSSGNASRSASAVLRPLRSRCFRSPGCGPACASFSAAAAFRAAFVPHRLVRNPHERSSLGRRARRAHHLVARQPVGRPRAPRSDGRSIGIFHEHRLDRAAPGAVILREQLLGRRRAARDEVAEQREIARLVAAVIVEAVAALQTRMARA